MAYLLRFLLLGLLFVLVARTFWRFVGSIVEGALGTTGRSSGPPENGVPMVRDPVCGTFVLPSRAIAVHEQGRATYFCSENCRQAFAARPSNTAAASGDRTR
jgi:YHS domain-containing protein